MSQLDDGPMARFHSLEEADGKRFVVREYIEGRTISDLLRTGPVEYAQVLQTAVEITIALKTLHQIGLVHGNITPANLFIDSRGKLRLADGFLGISFDAESVGGQNVLDDMTYLAPELLAGGEVTIASDHHALGAVLYLMLVGQPPFYDDDPETLVRTIRQEQVSFEVRPERNVPGVARMLIGKLLAKDPDDRFASTDELLFTIQGMMSLGTKTPVLVGKKKWSPSPRQYVMISMLVVLLVIFWLIITSTNQ
jgi:serine/threonine-protein kinase